MTPPNTEALRTELDTLLRAVYNTGAVAALNDEYPDISADDVRFLKNSLDRLETLCQQHDQARLTAILAQAPKLKHWTAFESDMHTRSESMYKEEGYNQALKEFTAAITAAFEAVV